MIFSGTRRGGQRESSHFCRDSQRGVSSLSCWLDYGEGGGRGGGGGEKGGGGGEKRMTRRWEKRGETSYEEYPLYPVG